MTQWLGPARPPKRALIPPTNVLSPADSARLARVEKEAHYGLTLKDLLWLVKLARRLEQQLTKLTEKPALKMAAFPPKGSAKAWNPLVERELSKQKKEKK